MVSHRKSAAAVSDKRAVVQIVECHCFKRDITPENGRVHGGILAIPWLWFARKIS